MKFLIQIQAEQGWKNIVLHNPPTNHASYSLWDALLVSWLVQNFIWYKTVSCLMHPGWYIWIWNWDVTPKIGYSRSSHTHSIRKLSTSLTWDYSHSGHIFPPAVPAKERERQLASWSTAHVWKLTLGPCLPTWTFCSLCIFVGSFCQLLHHTHNLFQILPCPILSYRLLYMSALAFFVLVLITSAS